jgi:hypothetical protein
LPVPFLLSDWRVDQPLQRAPLETQLAFDHPAVNALTRSQPTKLPLPDPQECRCL